MVAMARVGIFGGSFDPIHVGHLILAREAMEQLVLDRVIFIPAGISPHKLHRTPASAEVRLEMVRAAVEEEPGFEVDDCEVRREGPSFTIDLDAPEKSKILALIQMNDPDKAGAALIHEKARKAEHAAFAA